MKNNNNRYNAAVAQTLYEIESAVSYRNSFVELSKARPQFSLSFFSKALSASYELMIFYLIKVLDEHRDSASFWYLEKCNPALLLKLFKKYDVNIVELKSLSKKLKTIRDESFVHNDKTKIFDPAEVWTNAYIDVNIFNDTIDKLWKVLNDLHIEGLGYKSIIPVYKGEDIAKIVRIVRENGVEV